MIRNKDIQGKVRVTLMKARHIVRSEVEMNMREGCLQMFPGEVGVDQRKY